MALDPQQNSPPRRHHHGRQWPLGPTRGWFRVPGATWPAWNRSGCDPPGPRLGSLTSPVCLIRRKTGSARPWKIRVLMALKCGVICAGNWRDAGLTRLPQGPRNLSQLPERCGGTGSDHCRYCPGNRWNLHPGPKLTAGATNRPGPVQSLAREVEAGRFAPEDIDAARFPAPSTRRMPDPTLSIRTSGGYRMSNFLLWQSALIPTLRHRNPVARLPEESSQSLETLSARPTPLRA